MLTNFSLFINFPIIPENQRWSNSERLRCSRRQAAPILSLWLSEPHHDRQAERRILDRRPRTERQGDRRQDSGSHSAPILEMVRDLADPNMAKWNLDGNSQHFTTKKSEIRQLLSRIWGSNVLCWNLVLWIGAKLNFDGNWILENYWFLFHCIFVNFCVYFVALSFVRVAFIVSFYPEYPSWISFSCFIGPCFVLFLSSIF